MILNISEFSKKSMQYDSNENIKLGQYEANGYERFE